MSVADHPIPTRLATHVGGNGRLLATVMGLPLVDGLFPALVLAGVLDTWAGLLQVGLLVFGGSAATVVILAEFPGTFRDHLPQLLLIGAGLLVVAVIEAAFAPTVASVLDLAMFERFAALVIVTIAAKTASARVGSWLPRPSVTIALGVLASARPAGAEFALVSDPLLVVRAAAAVGLAMGFALGVLAARQFVVTHMDIERFRFGSAVALCLVGGSILGLVPEVVPVAVLGVSALFAYRPDGDELSESEMGITTNAGD